MLIKEAIIITKSGFSFKISFIIINEKIKSIITIIQVVVFKQAVKSHNVKIVTPSITRRGERSVLEIHALGS